MGEMESVLVILALRLLVDGLDEVIILLVVLELPLIVALAINSLVVAGDEVEVLALDVRVKGLAVGSCGDEGHDNEGCFDHFVEYLLADFCFAFELFIC